MAVSPTVLPESVAVLWNDEVCDTLRYCIFIETYDAFWFLKSMFMIHIYAHAVCDVYVDSNFDFKKCCKLNILNKQLIWVFP